MNKTLMRKIASVITQKSGAYYNQSAWSSEWRMLKDVPSLCKIADVLNVNVHECGTPACIAGYAVFLRLKEDEYIYNSYVWKNGIESDYIPNRAQKNLKLNYEQRCILFSSSPELNWPYPYSVKWAEAKGRCAQSKIAAQFLRDLANGDVEI